MKTLSEKIRHDDESMFAEGVIDIKDVREAIKKLIFEFGLTDRNDKDIEYSLIKQIFGEELTK